MIETLFESTPLLLTGVFVFGLIIGSFLNVVILRVPPLLEHDWRCQCQDLLQLKPDEDERPPGIVIARSKCPKCGHHIRAIENIPILSYLVLRGKCAACKTRISPRYPVVELTTAILFALTIWHFGPNMQGLTALFLTAFLLALAGIECQRESHEAALIVLDPQDGGDADGHDLLWCRRRDLLYVHAAGQ